MPDSTPSIEAFIARWQGADGRERANYQLFLTELAALLDLPSPEPAGAKDRDNSYVFERRVGFRHGDGSESYGYIDLYRRGCFVLEAKDVKESGSQRYDQGMLRARSQAENYARALPADEGRPPFVVVVDVGRSIELYSEFSRSGATYTPFPDPRSHRIALADLRQAAIREILRQLWLDPLALDPSRKAARVTREIAARLADLAKSLEHKHAPETVAQFLMRCLFTMFAEDVKLLPSASFRELLVRYAEQPDVAMRMLGQLWRDMDTGGFSAAIASEVLRFNGKLFKSPDTLPLTREQVALLIEAAKAKWENVEPAIFGTLLERALDPAERHALGAHFTPRAYVERLVLPTVIEPLRAEWNDTRAAALVQLAEAEQARDRALDQAGRKSPAERLKPYNAQLRAVRDTLLGFHQRLCNVRILDPACGSGNFLYVTLEHLKRLEGEVLNTLEEFGLSRLGVSAQPGLDIAAERALPAAAQTVDPHQLLGIELNPRAAAITEVVLWIGYLQWHFRTHGDVNPPQPVVKDFHNIANRDAVLAWDRVDYVTDARGIPLTRWDGRTMKASPVTGEPIPDETKRVPLERYVNPRKAAWPEADFVVGNPPFIGNKRMRLALGDGYVEALRSTWTEVPESADFVMYWWHHAAQLVARGALRRFGLITTNSIRQTFNRRVVEAALLPSPAASTALFPSPVGRGAGGEGATPRAAAHVVPSSGAVRHHGAFGHGRQPYPVGEGKTSPLSLMFAIPDHPWVDAADGAAVRIAMTVGEAGSHSGRLLDVIDERPDANGEIAVEVREETGVIHADLRIGADIASVQPLLANSLLSNRGVIPHGEGMIVSEAQAIALGLHAVPGLDMRLRPYRNGRDLTQTARDVRVIDMFGLSAEDVRAQFPAVYQWLLERVKPERDQNPRASRRENWWLFGENQPKMRASIDDLPRYIATPQTAKHRFFVFLDAAILPDDKLIAIGSDDACLLGVMSSRLHVAWALAAGARLGVGNDPVYNKSTCFECFPFPACCSLLPPGEGARRADEGKSSPIPSPPAPLPVGEGSKAARIRELGEQLDAHRKRQQAAHPGLTLTGMYNVLDKLRAGDSLTAKERVIHEQGLVSVLRQLHDELDLAVLDAYGWTDLVPLLQTANNPPSPARERWPEGPDVANDPSSPSPAGRGWPEPPDIASNPASPSSTGRRWPEGSDEGRKAPGRAKLPMPDDVRAFARALRRSQTDAEQTLWQLLRGRRLLGLKFRRQQPHAPYTLDFYCDALKLAVELDGSQHSDSARDRIRDERLAEDGIEVIRYWNHDVLARTEWVLEDLYSRLQTRASLGGEGGSTDIPSSGAARHLLPTGEGKADNASREDTACHLLPAGEGTADAASREDARRAFDEAILERLVALNAARAAEEKRGVVRWLRPDFQNPQGQVAPDQAEFDNQLQTTTATPVGKRPWPKDLPDQVRAVADVLSAAASPLDEPAIADRFSARGRWRERLPTILDTLAAIGRIQADGQGRYSAT